VRQAGRKKSRGEVTFPKKRGRGHILNFASLVPTSCYNHNSGNKMVVRILVWLSQVCYRYAVLEHPPHWATGPQPPHCGHTTLLGLGKFNFSKHFGLLSRCSPRSSAAQRRRRRCNITSTTLHNCSNTTRLRSHSPYSHSDSALS
jgi:hypothetical protein